MTNKFWLWFLGLFFLAAGVLMEGNKLSDNNAINKKRVLSTVESVMDEKAHIQEEAIKVFINKKVSNDSLFDSEVLDFCNKNSVDLYVYEHDSLIFWTSNNLYFEPWLPGEKSRFNYIELQNGIYQVCSQKDDEQRQIFAFFKIYNHYLREGEYFQNGLNKIFKIENECHISFVPEMDKGFVPVKNKEGDRFAFYLHIADKEQVTFFNYLVYLTSIVLLFVAIIKSCIVTGNFNWKYFWIGVSFLLLLFRILFFFDLFLSQLRESAIFSPEIFAYSRLAPSLGDFLLNLIVGYVLLLAIKASVNKSIPRDSFKKYTLLFFVFSGLIIGLTTYLIIEHIGHFVLDSSIWFDFNNFVSFNKFSVLAILALGIFYLYISTIVIIVKKLGHLYFDMTHFLAYIAVIELLFIILLSGFLPISLYQLSMTYLFIMLVVLVYSKVENLRIMHHVFIAVCYSAFLTIVFNHYLVEEEKDFRIVFANKLLYDKDYQFENQLSEIEKRLDYSQGISHYFATPDAERVILEDEYRYLYFSKFLNSHDIIFEYVSSAGKDSGYQEYQYLNELYNTASEKGLSNYFLQVKEISRQGGYLAKYEYCPDLGTPHAYLFIVLKPKVRSNEVFFNDFFSRAFHSIISPYNYSYALYQNGELVRSFGNYNFQINKGELNNIPQDVFTDLNEKSVLKIVNGEGSELFVLKKKRRVTDCLTLFSFIVSFYVLFAFSILILLAMYLLLLWLIRKNKVVKKYRAQLFKKYYWLNFSNISLRNKIIATAVLIVIAGFLISSFLSVVVVRGNYVLRQNTTMQHKLNLIQSEISNHLNYKNVTVSTNLLGLVFQLSDNNQIDINVYNTVGKLVVSNNQRIYSEGLIGSQINPSAFNGLNKKKMFSYSQSEKLGDLNYASYYTTLIGRENQVLGYLHLPYFSKDSDIKEEVSRYIISLMNVYLLIAVFSIAVALLVARALSKPLEIVTKGMSDVRLGQINKEIIWHGKDEVGLMVEEYNRMLKKLELSTKKLAESERESAWKEMAQQVAHEIKNPLTPMKLNIQHLQMAAERGDEDIANRYIELAEKLVAQIESMSRMAEAFSKFASISDSKLVDLNIISVLNDSANEFSDFEDIQIVKHFSGDKEIIVKGEPDELEKVFTNIIRNAKEASKEDELLKLDIFVKIELSSVIVCFKDNGKGISDEMKPRIFSPVFNSNTSNTGLGLAIAKEFVSHMDGKIWFESEPNNGTSFFVSIPLS